MNDHAQRSERGEQAAVISIIIELIIIYLYN